MINTLTCENLIYFLCSIIDQWFVLYVRKSGRISELFGVCVCVCVSVNE